MSSPSAGRTPSDVPEAVRERTVEALGDHFARDHIDLPEFERRVDRAYAASSHTELEALLSDLPALSEVGEAPVPVREAQPSAGKKRGFIVNVLGGSERRGRWTSPRRVVVVPLLGGAVLDFREAIFTTDVVDVTVVSLAGSTEILVPPGLRVEVGGVPIVGAFEHRSQGMSPDADAPLLRVNGLAVLASVEVKVLPPDVADRPDW